MQCAWTLVDPLKSCESAAGTRHGDACSPLRVGKGSGREQPDDRCLGDRDMCLHPIAVVREIRCKRQSKLPPTTMIQGHASGYEQMGVLRAHYFVWLPVVRFTLPPPRRQKAGQEEREMTARKPRWT